MRHALQTPNHAKIPEFESHLMRRAGARCELCAAEGVHLGVFQAGPPLDETHIEQHILICETCRAEMNHLEDRLIDKANLDHWHCLTHAVWSDVPVAKVLSLHILELLPNSESWGKQLLKQVYIEPELEAWLQSLS